MNFTGKRECGQSRLCITYVCTGANNGKIRAIYTSMVKNVLRNCYHLRKGCEQNCVFCQKSRHFDVRLKHTRICAKIMLAICGKIAVKHNYFT